jgi:hypothetical protein
LILIIVIKKMKIHNSYYDVKTGDTLFFSNNTATAFILKSGTSSLWNHVGLAIRIKDIKSDGTFTISTDNEGKLYVFDINSGSRYDPIFKKKIEGASFVTMEKMMRKYNIIAYRSIIDTFLHQPGFVDRVLTYITTNLGCKFTSGLRAFIGAWWNMDCLFKIDYNSDNNEENKVNEVNKASSKFCTQLVIDFYTECFDHDLNTLFTNQSPDESKLFSPELMSSVPCPCYRNKITTVYESYCDLITVILLPVIIILLFIVLLWYFLP